jgi:pyruvate dehydrogenase (quinone)
MTAADVLIEGLIDWGVEVVFGIPGDGINGIMESLRTHQEKIRFVQVRHEEAAAFMACGYAKFTGKMGVCLATSAPEEFTCSMGSMTPNSTGNRCSRSQVCSSTI